MKHLLVKEKKNIFKPDKKHQKKILALMYHSLSKISLNKKNLKKIKCIQKKIQNFTTQVSEKSCNVHLILRSQVSLLVP